MIRRSIAADSVMRRNRPMRSMGATRFTARLRASSAGSAASRGATGATTPALFTSTAFA